MPKVAYSEEDRQRVRQQLVRTALELMAKQGIRHTTVEQVYKSAGISRTFFYTFFPTKEDLIVEAIYLQQPRVLEYARSLLEDPALTWREAVRQFLYSCCYGEQYGIAVLTIEEQQLLFRHLTPESYRNFRRKQFLLFRDLLAAFGIQPDKERVDMLTNLSITAMLLRRAVPSTLPLLVPEAADATVRFQIDSITRYLEAMRAEHPLG
ncbi:MAG TPA: TetR/AcrR family transcriptional regulator [Candidatus Fournierella merdigallinarum]|nr:TetR/AcrR family transcriptional regulator [Candidatus Fournierella merdigallinarum]